MRGCKIVARIFLMLSVINFALTAPALVREHEVRAIESNDGPGPSNAPPPPIDSPNRLLGPVPMNQVPTDVPQQIVSSPDKSHSSNSLVPKISDSSSPSPLRPIDPTESAHGTSRPPGSPQFTALSESPPPSPLRLIDSTESAHGTSHPPGSPQFTALSESPPPTPPWSSQAHGRPPPNLPWSWSQPTRTLPGLPWQWSSQTRTRTRVPPNLPWSWSQPTRNLPNLPWQWSSQTRTGAPPNLPWQWSSRTRTRPGVPPQNPGDQLPTDSHPQPASSSNPGPSTEPNPPPSAEPMPPEEHKISGSLGDILKGKFKPRFSGSGSLNAAQEGLAYTIN